MLSYFVRRLTESFLVLAVMSLVIYLLIGLMPGDPIDIMIASDPEKPPPRPSACAPSMAWTGRSWSATSPGS